MSFSLTAKMLVQLDQKAITSVERQLAKLTQPKAIKLSIDRSGLGTLTKDLQNVSVATRTVNTGFISLNRNLLTLAGTYRLLSQSIDAFNQQEQAALKFSQITAVSLASGKAFQQQVRSVGMAIGINTVQLSEMSSNLAAAGLSTQFLQKNLSVLGKTLLSSQVAGSVQELEKMIVSLNKVFNVGANDLEQYLQIAMNLSRRYPIKFGEIASSVSMASGGLKNIGINAAQAMALSTVGGAHSGLSGSMLGTGLRSAAMTFGDPRKQEAMRTQYGLDLRGKSGMDLVNSILLKANQIKESKGESSQEFLGFMKLLSERRNSAIIRSLVDNMKELNQELQNIGETSKSLTDIQREQDLAAQTLKNKSMRVFNTLIDAVTKLGDTVSSSFSVKDIDGIVRALNNLGSSLSTFLLLLGGVGVSKLLKSSGLFAALTPQTMAIGMGGEQIISGQSRSSQILGRFGKVAPYGAMAAGAYMSSSENEYTASAGGGLMAGGAAAALGINPFISALIGATVAVNGFMEALNKERIKANLEGISGATGRAQSEFKNKGLSAVDFGAIGDELAGAISNAGSGRTRGETVWRGAKHLFSGQLSKATMRGASDSFWNEDMEAVKAKLQTMEEPIQALVDEFIKSGKPLKEFGNFMNGAGKEAAELYDIMDDMKLNASQSLEDLVKKRMKEQGKVDAEGREYSFANPFLARDIRTQQALNRGLSGSMPLAYGQYAQMGGQEWGSDRWKASMSAAGGGYWNANMATFDNMRSRLSQGGFTRENYKDAMKVSNDSGINKMIGDIVDRMSFEEFERGLTNSEELMKKLLGPLNDLWSAIDKTAQLIDQRNAKLGEMAGQMYEAKRESNAWADVKRSNTDIMNQAIFGHDRARSDTYAGMGENLQRLVGTTDVGALTNELNGFRDIINTTGGLTQAQQERQRAVIEGLGMVADVSKSLASSFKELQDIQQRMSEGYDTATEFLTGSHSDRRQIMKELDLANRVDNPMGLSEQNRKAWARGMQRQKSWIGANGMTGQENMQRILERDLPQFFGPNIAQRDALRDGMRQKGNLAQQAADALINRGENKALDLQKAFDSFANSTSIMDNAANLFNEAVNKAIQDKQNPPAGNGANNGQPGGKQEVVITGTINHNGLPDGNMWNSTRDSVDNTTKSNIATAMRNRDMPAQLLLG